MTGTNSRYENHEAWWLSVRYDGESFSPNDRNIVSDSSGYFYHILHLQTQEGDANYLMDICQVYAERIYLLLLEGKYPIGMSVDPHNYVGLLQVKEVKRFQLIQNESRS